MILVFSHFCFLFIYFFMRSNFSMCGSGKFLDSPLKIFRVLGVALKEDLWKDSRRRKVLHEVRNASSNEEGGYWGVIQF